MEKSHSFGAQGLKNITSGNPFLFYCFDNQIQIIKHRDDRIPRMGSDKDWLMQIYGGIYIYAHKNRKSCAFAYKSYFVHP